MLILPQDVQERLLVEALAARGVHVERGVTLTALAQRDDAAEVALRHADGRTETGRWSWVAGCDGAHSAVRHALGVPFPGARYARVYYVADVDARGPVINGDLDLALDTSDFLAVFPLPGEGRARLIGTIVAAVEHEARADVTWNDVGGRVLAHLPIQVERVNWFSTYHVHHRVAGTSRMGRAFLLGDAAHIHSPVGGQGMNTGLGDAVNLAWKLAMVVQGHAPEALLDTYTPERRAFALRLVATTDRAFTLISRDGPLARLVREHAVPAVLPRVFRLDAARRLLFRTVSQIAIQYRASALSEGTAGHVHAGDRRPWTGGNFAALAALDWQAHLYGVPAGDAAPTPRAGQAGEASPATNGPEAREAALAGACAGLGLPLHRFPADAARAGVPPGTLCLVRPDGYVALADPAPDPARLQAYFATRGLRLQ
jgi:2-polyprenyl-6-methoxyphenol hydroxylase-like FAD-dependent oxidoreductase